MTKNAFIPLELNENNISAANNASQFDAGSVLAREAQRVYAEGLKDFEPSPEWTQEQRDYMSARAAAWRSLVQSAYDDIIRRRASWMPWTVCGPSQYNARKNNAKADAQMNAEKEWRNKMDSFRLATQSRLKSLRPLDAQIEAYRTGRDTSVISADDPHACEKLAARIEYLKAEHEQNITLTKYYRMHKTMKGAPGISDHQAEKLDKQLEEIPEIMRSFGCSSNETANIRRLSQRLADLERQAAAKREGNAEETFDGFRLVKDTQENRVRFFFDDKPDENTRSLLKKWGFKWSPRAGAWQRQLTSNAMYAVKTVLKTLAPDEAQREQSRQEMALDEFAEKYAAE